MATMTLSTRQKRSTNRGSRGLRAGIDAFVRDSMEHAAPRPGRKIARLILAASLALVVLAGIVALQAAIHVHVWHLAG